MKIIRKILQILGVTLIVLLALFYKNDITAAELNARYAYNDSQFLDIDGQQVHYRIVGSGRPLVLLHGTSSSLHTWEKWADLLKDSFMVCMVDLPAFGLTGARADGDYSIKIYVDFLKKFTDKLQFKKFDLVGNSFGGHIAWEFTAAYPHSVRRLALLDASGYPRQSVPQVFKLAQNPRTAVVLKHITPRFFIAKNIREVYENDDLITDAAIDRYYAMALREGARQAFVDRANLHYFDNTAAIKTIDHPVLIMWGDNDQWIPKDLAYRFQEDLMNDTLVIMEKCGHVPMEEKPEESAAIARGFFLKSKI